MEIWRLIEDIPRSGSFNMAADKVLLEKYLYNSNPVLRIYEWECPTLSIGRNEVLDQGIDFDACERLGIPVIRRETGGKSVLHGFDITYSLVGAFLNSSFKRGILENYRYIAKGFYKFFEELGLQPKLQVERLKKGSDSHVCFAVPSIYEILVEGRKIIGSSQKIKNIKLSNNSSYRVFLQHGTIPIKDSVDLNVKILPQMDSENLRLRMHSLESIGIFPKFSKKNIQQLLYKSIQETFDLRLKYKSWTEDELRMISDFETDFKPIKKKTECI